MTKRVRAKHKIDRRLGENIWGRPKSPLNRRESRPGQHGERRAGKLSDFGQQLKAKQKLKGYYASISERQFRKIYDEASRQKGSTSEGIIGLLERRLDALVYRAKFVPTVFAARQFVSHGHVSVNGQRVTIRLYRLRIGDVVEVREKSRQLPPRARRHQERRARCARLHRLRPRQDDREARAHSGSVRRALSGHDGTEPRRRVLLALSSPAQFRTEKPSLWGRLFCLRFLRSV